MAVKVLHSLASSPQAVRRFAYEAEVLGRLDHPCIAKVFEAGFDDGAGGVPFIAMELVDGQDLLSHCDDHGLGRRQRLELFVRICEGVEHAHQNGVVHRDLKPANILVTANGQPKILDFGIARPVVDDGEATPGGTVTGFVVGSIAWMSPEQARGDRARIDVRSDVYSLGTVFFRLLADGMPIETSELAAWEAAQAICEKEPQRLARVDRDLRGDLDAIAAMALEKDPARRYPSAGALGRDVQRFLDHQPVEARGWSATYQFRKFARRHWFVVSAAALVFVSILVGLVTGIVLWRQAEDARGREELARIEVEREAETSTRVIEFFEGMFRQEDPRFARGATITVKEVLDRHADGIADGLEGEPLIRARLMDVIGTVYHHLWLFEECAPLFDQAFELRRAELGDEHPDVLVSMQKVVTQRAQEGHYGEAVELGRELLAARRRAFGSEDPRTVESLHDLGTALYSSGQLDEAEPILAEAHAARVRLFGEAGTDTLRTLQYLGQIQLTESRYEESQATFERLVELARSSHGLLHARTIIGMRALAIVYAERGFFADAERVCLEAIDAAERLVGEDSLLTVEVTGAMIGILKGLGRQAEAVDLQLETLARVSSIYGDDHPATNKHRINLALGLLNAGRSAEAEEAALAGLKKLRAAEGDHRDAILMGLSCLGAVYSNTGRLRQAEETFLEILDRFGSSRGDLTAIATLNSLGSLYLQTNRVDESYPHFQEGIALAREVLGDSHTMTFLLRLNLTEAQRLSGRLDEARAGRESLVSDVERAFGPDHPDTGMYRQALEQLR